MLLRRVYTELVEEYTADYIWGDEDKVEQMIMSSGREVTYSRDGMRHIAVAGIGTTVNGVRWAIVSYISYCTDRISVATYYENSKYLQRLFFL